jgi:hypothetical protein
MHTGPPKPLKDDCIFTEARKLLQKFERVRVVFVCCAFSILSHFTQPLMYFFFSIRQTYATNRNLDTEGL